MNYFTRNMGLTGPDGKKVYEIFLKVVSRPGVLGRITSLIGSLGVDLLGAHAQLQDKGEATISLYAEFSGAEVDTSQVVDALKKEKGLVLDIEVEAMEPVFFEHFYFPLTSGGRFRIFALGVDSWLSFEEELFTRFGSPAAALLHDSGRSVGRAVVRKLRERTMRVAITKEVVLSNFIQMFRAFGLGLLKISTANGSYKASIREPLMALREGRIMDNFSVGIVGGALEEIFEASLAAKHLRYLKGTKTLEFTFYTQH